MRLLLGGVVLGVAVLVGACAAITGVDQYKACGAGTECDASVGDEVPGTGSGTSASGGSSSEGSTGSGGSESATGDDAGDGGCTNSCANPDGGCVDYLTDNANCGACGAACAGDQTCFDGVCTGGAEATDASVDCPDGGCPTSIATQFSCPFGSCNGAGGDCTTQSGCFCSSDSQCKSGKCVKITGENDLSCSTCTGTGTRDGFDCELASPGIPALTSAGFACPANSGYKNTTLTCDPTHTNCYCSADNECPSGKCIPSSNNNSCSGAGPCSGSGTGDFRGCAPVSSIPGCPIYIGCPSNTECSYPTCYCTSDVACGSGHCIPSSHNGNCKGCTGTGSTDDGHGCMPMPSSVSCSGSGGSSCTTSLTPAPVLNSAHTACLCVDDSDCSSGKCVNNDNQCSGSCTGATPADGEDCRTAMATPTAWECPLGNCDTATSSTSSCSAVNVSCWCTSDSQCPAGAKCAAWAGCQAGMCTGTGSGNPFHCVP